MHRRMKYLTLMIVLSIFVLLLTSCQSATPTQTTDPETIQVTVSIVPLAYFVERIGGDLVSTNIMVLPGESPHSYEPTADQMKALSDSEIFFSIGVDYEATWLPRFEEINPDLLVVDSSEGIERIEMTASDEHEDETAEDHDGEQGLDPHVWLSPANGKIIAANILAALTDLDPSHADTYQTNAAGLIAEIDQVDTSIKETLANLEQTTLWFFIQPGAILPTTMVWSKSPSRLRDRNPVQANWPALSKPLASTTSGSFLSNLHSAQKMPRRLPRKSTARSHSLIRWRKIGWQTCNLLPKPSQLS